MSDVAIYRKLTHVLELLRASEGRGVNKMIAVLIFLLAAASLFSQDNPSPSAERSTMDDFIGAWTFNPDKSSHSGTERESINIELKDGAYKFTYDWLAENGTELNWWFVTDMKGGCVKHTQVNGQPMSSRSCMKRLSPHKFVDDTMLTDEYEVSSNGRTLKLRRKFRVPPNVQMTAPKDAILVFDRSSQ